MKDFNELQEKAGRRDKKKEQGEMEIGVEQRENLSSETRICRPDDQKLIIHCPGP